MSVAHLFKKVSRLQGGIGTRDAKGGRWRPCVQGGGDGIGVCVDGMYGG